MLGTIVVSEQNWQKSCVICSLYSWWQVEIDNKHKTYATGINTMINRNQNKEVVNDGFKCRFFPMGLVGESLPLSLNRVRGEALETSGSPDFRGKKASEGTPELCFRKKAKRPKWRRVNRGRTKGHQAREGARGKITAVWMTWIEPWKLCGMIRIIEGFWAEEWHVPTLSFAKKRLQSEMKAYTQIVAIVIIFGRYERALGQEDRSKGG